VVVTGMGAISAAGPDCAAVLAALREGRSALAPITLFDGAPYGGQLAGEARHLPRDPDVDRGLQLLRVATDEVISSAGWGPDQRGPDTAVVLGTCQGGIANATPIHRRYARRPCPDDAGEGDARAFAEYRPGAGAAQVASQIGAEGARSTVGMVCVSSSVALIHAVDLLRRGEARRVVAGGFESFTQFVFTGFHCIGAMASGPLRPFDERRDGTVLGEGAVLLTLELAEDAEARGATILAELAGGGFAADAFHMTAPDPEGGGLERAVLQAFADAGVGPEDIDYVCAHGTGTVFNDGMESVAFERMFAERAAAGDMPPVSGIKAIFGHTLGAAGALDAACCILAIQHQLLPPTAAHAEPLRGLDWDFVPGKARPPAGSLDVLLSTNSAFGGNNSALILRRWNGAEA
jgi:3-oxoacyl-[acyl-carrier-protein] synthase II